MELVRGDPETLFHSPQIAIKNLKLEKKGNIKMPRQKTDRPIQIHFRVNQNEYDAIKEKVEKSGLSMSDFARKTLLEQKVVSAPPADYFVLIREVKRVGSNLYQLVRKLNVLGIAHRLELERLEYELVDVVKMLYRTFRPGKEEQYENYSK